MSGSLHSLIILQEAHALTIPYYPSLTAETGLIVSPSPISTATYTKDGSLIFYRVSPQKNVLKMEFPK
jgi:hypothetical protein